MKRYGKIAAGLMVVLIAATGLGVSTNQYDVLGNAKTTRPWDSVSNAMVIGDTDNPEAAYEALIARTDMGTLGATNQRTLILLPGTYTLTDTWELDMAYVNVVSASGNYKDTIVTRATGGYTINQSVNNIMLAGFKVYNSGNAAASGGGTSNDCGLVITVTNPNCIYQNMYFDIATPGTYAASCIATGCDFDGKWINCGGGNYCFRQEGDKTGSTTYDMQAEMIDCWAGGYSFGGDGGGPNRESGEFSINTVYATIDGATFINCTAGNCGFGGCTTFGMAVTANAKFYFCTAGNDSYARAKEFAGYAYFCNGGNNCFSGGSAATLFSGYAEGCVATYGLSKYSFSTYTTGTISGVLKNCRIDTLAKYLDGTARSTGDCIYLSGIIENCGPYVPIAKTSNDAPDRFYNGCTYTNTGDVDTLTLTLLEAVPGMSYTFMDLVHDAGVDLYIDCAATNYFIKPDGTPMAASEQYRSEADAYAKVTATCYVTGTWQLENEIGTWVEETP